MDKSQQLKSYQQTPVEGNPSQTEAWALSQAALRMLRAVETGNIDEISSSVRLNWRLWTIFQSDLLAQDCPVPTEIRNNMLSLAAFVDKQTLAFMSDKDVSKVDVLINIDRELSMGMFEGQNANQGNQEQSDAPTEAVGLNLSDLEA